MRRQEREPDWNVAAITVTVGISSTAAPRLEGAGRLQIAERRGIGNINMESQMTMAITTMMTISTISTISTMA